jgi:hypothetical protein
VLTKTINCFELHYPSSVRAKDVAENPIDPYGMAPDVYVDKKVDVLKFAIDHMTELLKKYSPLIASLFIGVIWSLWHTPLFLYADSIQQSIPFIWYFVNTIAFSIILTKIYILNFSVIPVIILHSGLNAIGNYVPFKEGIGAVFPYFTISSLIVALILIIQSKKTINDQLFRDFCQKGANKNE